jgi:hypothetical protein
VLDVQLSSTSKQRAADALARRPREAEVVALPADEPLRREAEHFLNAIVTGATPHTDGQPVPLAQGATDLVRL